jgi:two-component sensor histidine kinase
MTLVLGSVRRLARSGQRRTARYFGISLAFIPLGILNDIAVAAGLYRGPYLTEAAYVALALTMSLGLTGEVIELSAVKRALIKSLADKTALLREIQHRVKNNLAVLSGLLRLQADAESDPRVHDRLATAVGRVQGIAAVYEEAAAEASGSAVNLAALWRRLAGDAERSFGFGAGAAVPLRVDSDLPSRPILLPMDFAASLGLVLHEIVVNSLRHAWPDGGGGAERRIGLRARLARRDGRTWLITEVGDNGRGCPGRPAEGLGLALIAAVAGQIEGRAVRESAGGTRWIVEAPLPEAEPPSRRFDELAEAGAEAAEAGGAGRAG